MADMQPSTTRPEPALVDLMLRVHRQFVTGLDLTQYADLSPEVIRATIQNAAKAACDQICTREEWTLQSGEREWLVEAAIDEAFGLGPLEPLLRERATDAILIRGPREVLVEREGRAWETAVVFRDKEHIQQVLERDLLNRCCLEVREAEVCSIRIDVHQLREAIASLDDKAQAMVAPAGERLPETQGSAAQSGIKRFWSRLFARR